MAVSSPYQVENIYLYGYGYHKINCLQEGLYAMLASARDTIYIDEFKIDAKSLRIIFERGRRCRKLILLNCKMNFKGDFILDPTNYYFKELDLYCTCDIKNSMYLNKDKFKKVMKALSNGNISLQKLHVKKDEFPAKEIESILKSIGIKDIEVIADNIPPEFAKINKEE
jgi:hypothetical protein